MVHPLGFQQTSYDFVFICFHSSVSEFNGSPDVWFIDAYQSAKWLLKVFEADAKMQNTVLGGCSA